MNKLKNLLAYSAYKKSEDSNHIQINKTQTGMALLEVLVAMLVFALAILPLVRLQVMSMDATKAGYYRTEAVSVAQSIMDYLVSDPQEIFSNTFAEIIVVSGQTCNDSGLKGMVCDIVNAKIGGSDNAHLFPRGNAVFCLKRENTPTGADSQVEMSVKAVWYIGKRSSDGNNLNQDLNATFCQGDWVSSTPENLKKENIDFIDIHMTY